MTLLPEVRRQMREAAHRQAESRWQRLRTATVARSAAAARHRRRLSLAAPVVSVFVVLAVAAAFLAAGGSRHPAGSKPPATLKMVFLALPKPQSRTVDSAALARTARIMGERLGVVFHDAHVTVSGRELVVAVHDARAGARARIMTLSAPARLAFYDWEANALTPNDKTVASELTTQDTRAITISEGSGGAAPGNLGAGSMTLYDAVKLASQQPAQASPDNARVGSQYYIFGAAGSAACAIAARDRSQAPARGGRCLLSGPADSQQELLSRLPAGVAASQGQELKIPPGTVVLQAADPNAKHQTNLDDPGAQFYVLRDQVVLRGNEITNPRPSRDQSGNPGVTFSFTSNGAKAFQKATSTIAHRGAVVSRGGEMLNQHFAVALDDKLLTVPQIDFKEYPTGIPGDMGADITNGFTIQSAQDLATKLRFGELPLVLQAR